MVVNDRPEFGKKLRTTFEILRKSVSQDVVEMLFQKLMDYEFDDVMRALDHILDSQKMAPTLVDIKEAIKNTGGKKIAYLSLSVADEAERKRKVHLRGFIEHVWRQVHLAGTDVSLWFDHEEAREMRLSSNEIMDYLAQYEKSLEKAHDTKRNA